MPSDTALVSADQAPTPFYRPPAAHLNAGAVAIESERAIAEAQGKLIIAKRFPRDEASAFARAMTSCQRPSLASSAIYSFPRSGQTVSGPSIRLAEELARCWGNIDYGIRELSRKDGVSEMEAYCWDLETNVMSAQKFTVRHIRDKRGGGEALKDERDIYEVTANMGARRLRARILAVLPPDLVDDAVAMCRQTAEKRESSIPLADRIKRLVMGFAKLDVTADMLAGRLGHQLDATTPDELADLREIYTSIKDGMTHVSDWFGAKAEEAKAEAKPASKLDALEGAAAADAVPDPSAETLAWVIAEIEKASSAQALDRMLASAAVKAKIGKLPAERQAQVDVAVKAARHGFGGEAA